jgi:hypothetical protein
VSVLVFFACISGGRLLRCSDATAPCSSSRCSDSLALGYCSAWLAHPLLTEATPDLFALSPLLDLRQLPAPLGVSVLLGPDARPLQRSTVPCARPLWHAGTYGTQSRPAPASATHAPAMELWRLLALLRRSVFLGVATHTPAIELWRLFALLRPLGSLAVGRS